MKSVYLTGAVRTPIGRFGGSLAGWSAADLGAAAATGLAMLISSSLLLVEVHGAHQQSVRATLKSLWQFWPLLAICGVCGLVAYIPFELWLSSLDPTIRYSRQMRVCPGVIAGVAYLACLGSMLAFQICHGGLSSDERTFLSTVIPSRWFAKYYESQRPSIARSAY